MNSNIHTFIFGEDWFCFFVLSVLLACKIEDRFNICRYMLDTYLGTRQICWIDQITKICSTFQMMAEEYCPTISAFQTHKVANQKPVPVTVYDYYDQCECAKFTLLDVLFQTKNDLNTIFFFELLTMYLFTL